MRARPAIPLLLLLLTVALPAAASHDIEVDLDLGAQVHWDDNFRAVLGVPQEDYSLEFDPRLRIRHSGGKLSYDVRYSPSYEAVYRINGANAWDHQVSGNVGYQITARTQIFASANFARPQSITSRRNEIFLLEDGEQVEGAGGAEADPNLAVEQGVSFGTQRRKSWAFSAGARHNFSGRMFGIVQASQSESRREEVGAVSALTRSVVGQLTYIWSGNDSIGLTTSWSKTSLAADTSRILAQLSWTHRFDNTTEFTFRVGPQWGRPDEPENQFFFAKRRRYPFLVDPVNEDPVLFETEGCPIVDGYRVLETGCNTVSVTNNVPLPINIANPFPPPPLINLRAWEASRNELSREYVDLAFIGSEYRRPNGASSSFDPIWSLSFRKNWSKWNVRLDLSQSEAGSETLGGSVDSSRANFRIGWTPTARWDLSFRLGWRRQRSSSNSLVPTLALGKTRIPWETLGIDQPFFSDNFSERAGTRVDPVFGLVPAFGDEIEVAEVIGIVFRKVKSRQTNDTYQANFRVRRQMTQRLSVTGSVGYRRRETRSSIDGLKNKSRINSTRVTLGFTYRFDPFRIKIPLPL